MLESDLPRLVYADKLDETAGVVPCDNCLDGGVGCPACEGAGYYYDPPYSMQRHKCSECDEGLLPDKCGTCRGSGSVSDGRAKRAELIRVQCQIEAAGRRPCAHPLTHDAEPRPNCLACLLAKEKELTALMPTYGFPHGCRLEYRRGFVESASGPLSAFWEERRCAGCAGSGVRYSGCGYESYDCHYCKGSGRVSGPTPAMGELVRREPVTRIGLSDQTAYPPDRDRRVAWFHPDVPPGNEPRTQLLPVALFRRLDDWDKTQGASSDRVKWYATRESADAALSRALLGAALAGSPTPAAL